MEGEEKHDLSGRGGTGRCSQLFPKYKEELAELVDEKGGRGVLQVRSVKREFKVNPR